MSTTGHESEAINVQGLKASLQEYKSKFDMQITLQQAPTASTLTYTHKGKTYPFKIGDEVRVPDANNASDGANGYVYYKLYDIKNSTAYWDMEGSGDVYWSTLASYDGTHRIDNGYINLSNYVTFSALSNYIQHIEVGEDDLTARSGTFFFGGNNALRSDYDYVGFQIGNSVDKWQMVVAYDVQWRQNDNGGTDSTDWSEWRTFIDSANWSSYINLSNYLPLSGGTITGNLGIGGTCTATGFKIANGTSSQVLTANGGFSTLKTINGNSIIGTGDIVVEGAVTSIKVGTTTYNPTSGVISLPAVSSQNAGSATQLQTARTIWGQSFNGTANVSGNLTSVNAISMTANLTLGTGSNGIYLNGDGIRLHNSSNSWKADIIAFNTGNGDVNFSHSVGIGITSPSYKLHVDGAVGATAFTNTSDIRMKEIVSNKLIDINDIASAPAFLYKWKSADMDKDVHVGTSAQYWQVVLPEVVTQAADDTGTLSMQYGVAGLIAAIITARKVQDHESRIRELEKENEKLRTEVGQLRIG